jgi:predicted acylesterase/phospholipase RssA
MGKKKAAVPVPASSIQEQIALTMQKNHIAICETFLAKPFLPQEGLHKWGKTAQGFPGASNWSDFYNAMISLRDSEDPRKTLLQRAVELGRTAAVKELLGQYLSYCKQHSLDVLAAGESAEAVDGGAGGADEAPARNSVSLDYSSLHPLIVAANYPQHPDMINLLLAHATTQDDGMARRECIVRLAAQNEIKLLNVQNREYALSLLPTLPAHEFELVLRNLIDTNIAPLSEALRFQLFTQLTKTCLTIAADTNSDALFIHAISKKYLLYMLLDGRIAKPADQREILRANELSVEVDCALSQSTPDLCKKIPFPTQVDMSGDAANLKPAELIHAAAFANGVLSLRLIENALPGVATVQANEDGIFSAIKGIFDLGVDDPAFIRTVGRQALGGGGSPAELTSTRRRTLQDFLNRADGSGRTLLMLAAERGLSKTVKMLCEYGAEVNKRNTAEGQTALHLAARHNNYKVLRELLKKRASLTIQDNAGNTPLHLAVLNNAASAVQDLWKESNSSQRAIRNGAGQTAEACLEGADALTQRVVQECCDREKDFLPGAKISNVAVQGGGPKGIAYVNALKKLTEVKQPEAVQDEAELTADGAGGRAPTPGEEDGFEAVEALPEAPSELVGVREGKAAIDLANIKRVAGASAGAITALLIALGLSIEEIDERLMALDLSTFQDENELGLGELGKNLQANGFSVGNITSLAMKFAWNGSWTSEQLDKKYKGACFGDVFRVWAAHMVAAKFEDGCTYFQTLKIPEVIFEGIEAREATADQKLWLEIAKALYKDTKEAAAWAQVPADRKRGFYKKAYAAQMATFKDLKANKNADGSYPFKDMVFYGSNITTMGSERFSFEDTPDYCVVDALRVSMAIPVFFAPWNVYEVFENPEGYRERRPANHDVYMDGGVFNNYPVTFADRPGQVNWATLGLKIATGGEASLTDEAGLFSMIERLGGGLADSTAPVMKVPENAVRTLNIQCAGASTLEFNMDATRKEEVKAAGEASVVPEWNLYHERMKALDEKHRLAGVRILFNRIYVRNTLDEEGSLTLVSAIRILEEIFEKYSDEEQKQLDLLTEFNVRYPLADFRMDDGRYSLGQCLQVLDRKELLHLVSSASIEVVSSGEEIEEAQVQALKTFLEEALIDLERKLHPGLGDASVLVGQMEELTLALREKEEFAAGIRIVMEKKNADIAKLKARVEFLRQQALVREQDAIDHNETKIALQRMDALVVKLCGELLTLYSALREGGGARAAAQDTKQCEMELPPLPAYTGPLVDAGRFRPMPAPSTAIAPPPMPPLPAGGGDAAGGGCDAPESSRSVVSEPSTLQEFFFEEVKKYIAEQKLKGSWLALRDLSMTGQLNAARAEAWLAKIPEALSARVDTNDELKLIRGTRLLVPKIVGREDSMLAMTLDQIVGVRAHGGWQSGTSTAVFLEAAKVNLRAFEQANSGASFAGGGGAACWK